MGMPDTWFKLVRDVNDEDWNMHHIWHVITDHRPEEHTISYVESHDQAIVGDKTMIFELIDSAMYYKMSKQSQDIIVDRGMALHKMLRLATIAAANGGYLNFMGNEFGHPEWIDFPREGNGWSHHYARRQWSLRDNPDLRYHFLADFDAALLAMFSAECSADEEMRLLCAHDGDKVLAFTRGKLLFVFNFHPSESFADYGIYVDGSSSYKLVLDSDEDRFGGHARLEAGQEFLPLEVEEDEERRMLLLYLPSRTALVLKCSDVNR
jgi:1,4-alpha-glucan branching enzyme